MTQTLLNTEQTKFQIHFLQSTWPSLCSRETSGLTSTSMVSCGPQSPGWGCREREQEDEEAVQENTWDGDNKAWVEQKHGWGTLEEVGQRTQNSTGVHQGRERREQAIQLPSSNILSQPSAHLQMGANNNLFSVPVSQVSEGSKIVPDLLRSRFCSHHHRTTHSPGPDLL